MFAWFRILHINKHFKISIFDVSFVFATTDFISLCGRSYVLNQVLQLCILPPPRYKTHAKPFVEQEKYFIIKKFLFRISLYIIFLNNEIENRAGTRYG